MFELFPFLVLPSARLKTTLTRVVRSSSGQMVPFSVWKAQEAALAANARMPQSSRDDFDFSQRIPGGKETYDYTQRRPSSQKAEGYDFTF